MKIKETNIEKIRETAIFFLNTEIQPTKVEFIASHPFASSWVTIISSEEGLMDLHDEENQKKWRSFLEKKINSVSLEDIFYMLHKPYILNFLKFTERYMSDEDLGKILGTFWQNIEQISFNASMSGSEIIKVFKRASKKTLMDEEELNVFNNLPEQVTIYRGVTSYNNKNKKAFSWTTDREIAEWFANRFSTGTGEIWTLTVPKERILCAFTGREKELIVNLYRYEALCEMIVEKL